MDQKGCHWRDIRRVADLERHPEEQDADRQEDKLGDPDDDDVRLGRNEGELKQVFGGFLVHNDGLQGKDTIIWEGDSSNIVDFLPLIENRGSRKIG